MIISRVLKCLIVLACAGVTGCAEQDRMPPAPSSSSAPVYIGSNACAECHRAESELWRGSHHFGAMRAPSQDSVLGDFADATFEQQSIVSRMIQRDGHWQMTTDGPSGALETYRVRYTFGVQPLQQYLLELPNGALHASAVAWDSRPGEQGGQRWFHLQPDSVGLPDDVLHWTQNAFNWQARCADCHSTGLRKGYNPDSHAYTTEFSEETVGCEACHGPGANHAAAPANVALGSPRTQTQQLNTCAPCHSRRGQLREGFQPAAAYLDFYQPALLDAGLYHPDGQVQDEVYVYGSFLQSKMQRRGVSCGDCHDPHSAEVRKPGNAVCTQCHSINGNPRFPTLKKRAYDDVQHHMHKPGSAGARCAACHMPAQTFMRVDERHDHSFRIPRPDLSVSLGLPNTCSACHSNQSAHWAAQQIEQHVGHPPTPHFAVAFSDARQGRPSAEGPLAEIAGDASQAIIVRATALSLMDRYQRDLSGVALRAGLRDEAPLMRIGALRGAVRWPAEVRWRLTSHLLKDPYLAVRVEAVRTLLTTLPMLTDVQRTVLRQGIDEYLATLALNADQPESLTAAASVYGAIQDFERAEEHLRRALRINRSWVPGMLNLADLLRLTGRDRQAQPLLDQALAVTPVQAEALVAKAFWLVRQQQHAEALPLLEQAWSAEPQQSRYAYIYAVALHSQQQSQRALDVLREQLQRTPQADNLLQTAIDIARQSGLPGISEK